LSAVWDIAVGRLTWMGAKWAILCSSATCINFDSILRGLRSIAAYNQRWLTIG